MYTDNFVLIRGGHSRNFPQSVEGQVELEWATTTHEYRRMSTGKVYKRHTCYHPQSPYGWELVTIGEQHGNTRSAS